MQSAQASTVISGHGQLKTTSEPLPVNYHFNCAQNVATQNQRIIGRGTRSCTGTVSLLNDNRVIPNGIWHLILESGEQWRVENDNGEWSRLSDD